MPELYSISSDGASHARCVDYREHRQRDHVRHSNCLEKFTEPCEPDDRESGDREGGMRFFLYPFCQYRTRPAFFLRTGPAFRTPHLLSPHLSLTAGLNCGHAEPHAVVPVPRTVPEADRRAAVPGDGGSSCRPGSPGARPKAAPVDPTRATMHNTSRHTNHRTIPRHFPAYHESPKRSAISGRPDGSFYRSCSPYHAYSPSLSASSPKGYWVVLPARQAYSHSASVGRR